MATKFYKNSTGGYVFGDGVLGSTAPKYIEEVNGLIKLTYNDKIIYHGAVTSLLKENDDPYTDYADLIAGVGDFFASAPLSGAQFKLATLLASNWDNATSVEIWAGSVTAPPQQTRVLLNGDYSGYNTFTADQFQIEVDGNPYIGESVETIGSDFIVHFSTSAYKLIFNNTSVSFENITLSAATITEALEIGAGLREYTITDGFITQNTYIDLLVRDSGKPIAIAAKMSKNGTFKNGSLKLYAQFVPTADIEIYYMVLSAQNVSGLNSFPVNGLD